MKFITPKTYLIAETTVLTGIHIPSPLEQYLEEIGAKGWETDAPSRAEGLIEVGGRLCYRSFEPGLNANVTRVREGNQPYIKNILDHKHGSVLEHATCTFIFHDVSRVFTHELVRHRQGVAISQESLRYVRLDKLKAWMPESLKGRGFSSRMQETFTKLEEMQRELAEHFRIDEEKDFNVKKKLTSAFRRLAPIGLATSIMWTSNMRNLRYVIEQRTNEHAEEEMRFVFSDVYEIVSRRYPNIFQDAEVEMIDGYKKITFKNSKV